MRRVMAVVCMVALLGTLLLVAGCKGSGPGSAKPAPVDQNAKMMQMQKQMMQGKMGAAGQKAGPGADAAAAEKSENSE